jgi:hypothetical protein
VLTEYVFICIYLYRFWATFACELLGTKVSIQRLPNNWLLHLQRDKKELEEAKAGLLARDAELHAARLMVWELKQLLEEVYVALVRLCSVSITSSCPHGI